MKIVFITSARSDYDRQKPVWDAFRKKGVEPVIAAMHSHLSAKYGNTLKDIENDGFSISARIRSLSDGRGGVTAADSVAMAVTGLTKFLAKSQPDYVSIFGDRMEMLAPAIAAVSLKIPIIHICGGEITEGAVDDQIRHMLTKAAHIHFTANDVFSKRVLQMGEEPWRVFCTGSPSIDALKRVKLYSKKELGIELKLDLNQPTALVAFHPETLKKNPSKGIRDLLSALRQFPLQYVLTYPNSDEGSYEIITALHQFAQKNKNARLFKNLGAKKFYSLLKYASLMAGNSSSGIVEAPSFSLPAVNIGTRQDGRVFAKNVVRAGTDRPEISAGIRKALRMKRVEMANPYGDGRASEKIVSALFDIHSKKKREEILHKKFEDMK